jgi:hypothetical protein
VEKGERKNISEVLLPDTREVTTWSLLLRGTPDDSGASPPNLRSAWLAGEDFFLRFFGGWRGSAGHSLNGAQRGVRAPTSAVITLLIPPRILKSPTTSIHAGCTTAARSSRIRFTARS